MTLTDDDLALLDFEAGWWKYPGVKEQEIRDRFGITPVRYYQRLMALVEEPAALAARPTVVRRLRRIRDRRRAHPAAVYPP